VIKTLKVIPTERVSMASMAMFKEYAITLDIVSDVGERVGNSRARVGALAGDYSTRCEKSRGDGM
jgi:hypothetical protein